MPVYNGERFLPEAIDSILNQTWVDFELLIVDDGSTDGSSEILSGYANRDKRVTLIRNETNLGLVRTLNRGLDLTDSPYIARMDQDDISLPDRLQKQAMYLQQHPEVGVLGTNITYIDSEGRDLKYSRPKHNRYESPLFIRWSLLWRNPIYHPTVMIRRAVLERTGFKYNPEYEAAEDYEFWARLSHHTILARLEDVTVKYRISATSMSKLQNTAQREKCGAIMRRELIFLLDSDPSEKGFSTLTDIMAYQHSEHSEYEAAANLLLKAYNRFGTQPLSNTDQMQINADAGARLRAIAVASHRSSTQTALSLLFMQKYISWKELLSLQTVKRLLVDILWDKFRRPKVYSP